MELLISKVKNVNYYEKNDNRVEKFREYYINNKRLVKGNSKLYNILIFDMPAIKTCLNCSLCKNTCYAYKAERQYLNTAIYRETNFLLYKENSNRLKELIVYQLKNSKHNVVRLHSSGDFFEQGYIDFWYSIISIFPNIKFYSYTKVIDYLDFSKILKLDNFNLINSFIDGKLNYGSLKYCEGLKKVYGSFICPATKKKNIKCGLHCTYCIDKNNVCFVKH